MVCVHIARTFSQIECSRSLFESGCAVQGNQASVGLLSLTSRCWYLQSFTQNTRYTIWNNHQTIHGVFKLSIVGENRSHNTTYLSHKLYDHKFPFVTYSTSYSCLIKSKLQVLAPNPWTLLVLLRRVDIFSGSEVDEGSCWLYPWQFDSFVYYTFPSTDASVWKISGDLPVHRCWNRQRLTSAILPLLWLCCVNSVCSYFFSIACDLLGKGAWCWCEHIFQTVS